MRKTILVTGAGSGFGLGLVNALHALNHHVVAVCQFDEQASQLSADGVESMVVDITSAKSVSQLSSLKPDVLVNNAGRGQLGQIATVKLADVQDVFNVNVFGTLRVTQAVLPSMRERGSGRIIIVSSIAGIFSGLLSGPYSMTKHALEAVSYTHLTLPTICSV